MSNADLICIFPAPILEDPGYIYLVKIEDSRRNIFYKIGCTKNLKIRVDSLIYEHCPGDVGFVYVLAYGRTERMRQEESNILSKYYRYAHSFGSSRPSESREYFDFDYGTVLRVVTEFKKRFWDTYSVISPLKKQDFPQPRMIPYVLDDAGYWETRQIKCRQRGLSDCLLNNCNNYENCLRDYKYAMCA